MKDKGRNQKKVKISARISLLLLTLADPSQSAVYSGALRSLGECGSLHAVITMVRVDGLSEWCYRPECHGIHRWKQRSHLYVSVH